MVYFYLLLKKIVIGNAVETKDFANQPIRFGDGDTMRLTYISYIHSHPV